MDLCLDARWVYRFELVYIKCIMVVNSSMNKGNIQEQKVMRGEGEIYSQLCVMNVGCLLLPPNHPHTRSVYILIASL